jgi:hypothetical protein
MLGLLRRVPGVVWLGLLVAAVLLWQRWEIDGYRKASEAARDAQFKAAIGAIEAKEAPLKASLPADYATQGAMKAEIARQVTALAALAARSSERAAVTARDAQAADELAAHPDCTTLLASAARLKVRLKCYPVPVQR